MELTILGLHHITAIAGDAQRNLDFYRGVMGLRLVKKTVNFDDPDTYHLYYGDSIGTPGTILTFFPWQGVSAGRGGAGQAAAVALSIPKQAYDYWRARLLEHNVAVDEPFTRFGEPVIGFADPDGMRLELVASGVGSRRAAVPGGAVPPENALIGLHSTAIVVSAADPTELVLTERLGFRKIGLEGDRTRFECGDGGPGTYVDVISEPGAPKARLGGGSIHHVAWRAPDDATQLAWRKSLAEHHIGVTKVQDRCYFNAIYFQEPGEVLFEIATDSPGFLVDESRERLGTQLQLPHWLAGRRERIIASLPKLL